MLHHLLTNIGHHYSFKEDSQAVVLTAEHELDYFESPGGVAGCTECTDGNFSLGDSRSIQLGSDALSNERSLASIIENSAHIATTSRSGYPGSKYLE